MTKVAKPRRLIKLKPDTHAAILLALQAADKLPAEAADQLEVRKLAATANQLLERDQTSRVAQTSSRKMTSVARQVLHVMRQSEWVSATSLQELTHRFGDALYILRSNGYVIARRKVPRTCFEYKLVRGPGWPGWVNGRAIIPGSAATRHKR